MKDPTRIPRVLSALRDVWEGQPDLSFAALWGIIENHGVSWGSEDDDVLDVLHGLARVHPPSMSQDDVTADMVVRFYTQSPERVMCLDGATFHVTVRDTHGEITPTTWMATRIERARTSSPLVIQDSNKLSQRLGVIERIHVLARPQRPLTGMTREQVGEVVYGVVGTQGTTAYVGRDITVVEAQRRSLEQQVLKYRRVVSAEPGQELRVELADGGEVNMVGEVQEIFVADAADDYWTGWSLTR